jgi:hypothetical protein
MRATQVLAFAVLASASFSAGAAMANEALHLTPPLFREQARETQRVRSVSDLSTTPQPVAAAKTVVAPRPVPAVGEVEATGSF